MFSLDERDPHDQKTYCDVCQSWRHSPFSCGCDDCGRPETPTMQREVAKALAKSREDEAIRSQRDELLKALQQTIREYGAFGHLSGETLVQARRAIAAAGGAELRS